MRLFMNRHRIPLLIGLFAFAIRIMGINWDSGTGLHPDERMLMIVVERISLTNLNPEFFNYGSLPIYLLALARSVAGLFDARLLYYPDILYVGRLLSTLTDTGITVLIAVVGTKLWNKKVGLIAGVLYALAVFPIQNSHFYIVDPQLSWWILLTFWILTREGKVSARTFLAAGITSGLAAATKFSGIVTFGLPILWMLLNRAQFVALPKRNVVVAIFAVFGGGILAFFITQPYALLDSLNYIAHVRDQVAMNSDASVFPYTIQFIHSTAYLDPLYGILSWGLGTPLAITSLLGLGLILIGMRKKRNLPIMLLITFFTVYFLIFGRSAVKYMRYYLPLYPFFILGAGVALEKLLQFTQRFQTTLRASIIALTALLLLIWPVMYLTAILGPHTRVQTSDWIIRTLPSGSTLLTELWDDELPFNNNGRYKSEQLDMYATESPAKQATLEKQLSNGDYLILSSKRVYNSIIINKDRYPETAQWYIELFNGRTNYQLIKTFTSYPRIEIGPFSYVIPDNYSPESFTIFDHPKVMIFRNIEKDY